MNKNYDITFEITEVLTKEVKKRISFDDQEISRLAMKHGFKYKLVP